jgi:hypothetical protein
VNYLVLNVREYSFKDDNDKRVEGATITYLDLTNEPDEGEKGFAPLSISGTLEKVRDFTEVPGYYEMNFTQRRGAKNRATLVFDRARLVAAVDFTTELVR